jgi:protein-tyrosine-phosphatase
MAASLAAAALAGTAEVASAGLEAWGQRASDKTIALLRRRYGVDLSSHRSEDVKDLLLDDFYRIVAMKAEYAERLTRDFAVPTEKIITWDVDDPWIEGTDRAYEACLAEIERLLATFLDQLNPDRRADE